MNLQEFINKNKDDDAAIQNVRCGSCGNELVHCGKYEIVKLDKEEEGIICETCKRTNRKLLRTATTTSKTAAAVVEEVKLVPPNNNKNKKQAAAEKKVEDKK